MLTRIALTQIGFIIALSWHRQNRAVYVDHDEANPCEDTNFERCCPDVHWPMWYLEPSLKNLKAVETYTIGSEVAPEDPENPKPGRWSQQYGCLDTASQAAMLRRDAGDRSITRYLSPWTYTCPVYWLMVRRGPFAAVYNHAFPVFIAECLPPDLVQMEVGPGLLPEEEVIAHGLVRLSLMDCFDVSVSDARITRIEVAVLQPSRSVLDRKQAQSRNVRVPYMSLADLTTSRVPAAVVNSESWVQGMVNMHAHVGHTYQGCARATDDADVVLWVVATGSYFDMEKRTKVSALPPRPA